MGGKVLNNLGVTLFLCVPQKLQYESHFLADPSYPEGEQLHLMRIVADPEQPGTPVFLLHGSIENGRIFYSANGKGFAPFLAREGFDVYVADLRGRGKSVPAISRRSDYGQSDAIAVEIPRFLAHIVEQRGDVPMHLGAHSWGGVNLLSYLARPKVPVKVASLVFFGTKRRITVRSLRYHWMISFGWHTLGRVMLATRGYLSGRIFGMGSDNISRKTWRETNEWIYRPEWTHWEDGFDYSAAWRKMKVPPLLSFAGANDQVLGNPTDVQLTLNELGPDQPVKFELLAKQNCHLHDYGHIDMLTHPLCEEDHFQMALHWMKKHG